MGILLLQVEVTQGELGGHHLPHFAIKWQRGAERKGSNTLGKHISLKISEKKEKEEENKGQFAFVMLPQLFHD